MRYMIERGAERAEVELPEGWTFTSIPCPAKAPEGEATLYRLEFFDGEGKSGAVFTNVAAFYPTSFIPPKDQFANIPNDLGWLKPAA
ncbi:hypothetical protein [Micromonospora sp. CB01531]|uniref:hypothetical protein n=1 Tax=Micromonospora sp. CB01531 TaxID=1718947 RepID=UPI000AD3BF25|nr:hypothetical protein [Micromonospora sp. CB01531]